MKRIFVIDDDRIAVAVVRAALGNGPWIVESSGSAEDAAPLLLGGRWDVVLVDIELGEASGLDLVRALRTQEASARGSRVGVVALTAHREGALLREAIGAGCDGVLMKPVAPALLREALARFARTTTPPPWPAVPSGADLAAELSGDVDALVLLLEDARTAGDCAALRRLGHRLAGTAGSVGRDALGEAARDVELAAARGDLEAACRAADQVVAFARPDAARA